MTARSTSPPTHGQDQLTDLAGWMETSAPIGGEKTYLQVRAECGMCVRKDVALHGTYGSGPKTVHDSDAGEAASWSSPHTRPEGQLPGGV